MNKPNELYHHGIMGMKWGVRRYQNSDGSYTAAGKSRYGSKTTRKEYNEKYTAEKRHRDEKVYSKGAVKRINKALNKGGSLSGARSREADRIASFRRASRINRRLGRTAGTIIGANVGFNVANALIRRYGKGDLGANLVFRRTMTAGTAVAFRLLGAYGGSTLTMRAGGYDPAKLRR